MATAPKMNWLRILAITLAAGFVLAAPAQARIHPQMFCWDPDSEFPVGCNEDDEEDDDVRPVRPTADRPRAVIQSLR